MDIRMYELKVVQDAGGERAFHPGVVYDVSPVLGAQWVRSGVAAPAADLRPAAVDETPRPRKARA